MCAAQQAPTHQAAIEQPPLVVYVNLDKKTAYPIDWSQEKINPALQPSEATPMSQLRPQGEEDPSSHPQLTSSSQHCSDPNTARGSVQAHPDSATADHESRADGIERSSARASDQVVWHRNIAATTTTTTTAASTVATVVELAALSIDPSQAERSSTGEGSVQGDIGQRTERSTFLPAAPLLRDRSNGSREAAGQGEGVVAPTFVGSEATGGDSAALPMSQAAALAISQADITEAALTGQLGGHTAGRERGDVSGEPQGDREVQEAQDWFAALPASEVPCIGVMPDAALCICRRYLASEILPSSSASLYARRRRLGSQDIMNRTLRYPRDQHLLRAAIGLPPLTETQPATVQEELHSGVVADSAAVESSTVAEAAVHSADTGVNIACSHSEDHQVPRQPSKQMQAFTDDMHAQSNQGCTSNDIAQLDDGGHRVQTRSENGGDVGTSCRDAGMDGEPHVACSQYVEGGGGCTADVAVSDGENESDGIDAEERANIALNLARFVALRPRAALELDNAVSGAGGSVPDDAVAVVPGRERARRASDRDRSTANARDGAQERDAKQDTQYYFYKKELSEVDFQHVHKDVYAAAWGNSGIDDVIAI